jgi:hypothetical protein
MNISGELTRVHHQQLTTQRAGMAPYCSLREWTGRIRHKDSDPVRPGQGPEHDPATRNSSPMIGSNDYAHRGLIESHTFAQFLRIKARPAIEVHNNMLHLVSISRRCPKVLSVFISLKVFQKSITELETLDIIFTGSGTSHDAVWQCGIIAAMADDILRHCLANQRKDRAEAHTISGTHMCTIRSETILDFPDYRRRTRRAALLISDFR